MLVFLAEDTLCCRDAPIDGEGRVIEGNAAFGLRGIVVVALIDKDCDVAEDSKAVGKAARDEEHAVVVLVEFYCYMLTESRAAMANVHCHVEHTASNYTNEFCLSVRRTLEMKSSHYSCHTTALVLLNEMGVADFLQKLIVTERLKEIPPGIVPYFWLEYLYI